MTHNDDGPVSDINHVPGIDGPDVIKTWHNRLGHAATKLQIQAMVTDGILPPAKAKGDKCDPCEKGKFKRSYRGSLTKARAPGHLHTDTVGRIKPASREGYEYFMTHVDEFCRHVTVKPLKLKSDASPDLIKYVRWFERQASVYVKSLHSDGGTEFKQAQRELNTKGVNTTVSTPYTPASNGLAERTQGVLLSLARSCLIQAKLQLSFWQYYLKGPEDHVLCSILRCGTDEIGA